MFGAVEDKFRIQQEEKTVLLEAREVSGRTRKNMFRPQKSELFQANRAAKRQQKRDDNEDPLDASYDDEAMDDDPEKEEYRRAASRRRRRQIQTVARSPIVQEMEVSFNEGLL